MDWLFSHPGPIEGASAPELKAAVEYDNMPSTYGLWAFIAHRGSSAHCGHYVAYIKKSRDWVLFNDNKVVAIPDINPYLGQGYIYFYKRLP